jgi:hypothetical protein
MDLRQRRKVMRVLFGSQVMAMRYLLEEDEPESPP